MAHRPNFNLRETGTLWLTGLSGSGKSTLAEALAARLSVRGVRCKIVDGDELRDGLCRDLGYSREDRRENIRRAAQVCRILNSAGVTVIAALISPYRDDREIARQVIGAELFHEIWIATPLEICEIRDPKGLYRKARSGLISGFTGIDDPYEAPADPHLTLNTHLLPISDCIELIEGLIGREKR